MSAIIPYNVNPIVGALEVGVFIGTFLFGVASVQAWIYYERFPGDKPLLKWMVGVVWLLEFGHIVCDAHAVYVMAVTNYGKPWTLIQVPSTIFATFVLTGIMVLIVQGYYAYRIYILTQRLYIPVFCWASSVTVLVIAILVTVYGLQAVNTVVGYERGRTTAYAGLILGATVDTVIAVTLCWFFHKSKDSTTRRTARTMDRLIAWTMQTGVLTSITAIAIIPTYQTMSENFVWVGVWTVSSGVIANSFYALLNARTLLRNTASNTGPVISLNVIDDSRSSSSKAADGNLQFNDSPDPEAQVASEGQVLSIMNPTRSVAL